MKPTPKELLGAILFALLLLVVVLAMDKYAGSTPEALQLQGVIKPRP